MADVTPFPFATLQDLKDRWPDLPAGADNHATVKLEDASQFILDVAPSAEFAHERTRRRVVCDVVRRSMEADSAGLNGLDSLQAGGGPFQFSGKASNPHGDFYLTKQEKKALGVGQQRAGQINMLTHLNEVQ